MNGAVIDPARFRIDQHILVEVESQRKRDHFKRKPKSFLSLIDFQGIFILGICS